MREDFSRSLPHFFDQAPPARYSSAMWTAMALNGNIRGLAVALDAIREKKEGEAA